VTEPNQSSMWSDPTASATPAPAQPSAPPNPFDFAPLTAPPAYPGPAYPPPDPAYPPVPPPYPAATPYPVTAPPAAYGGYGGYGGFSAPPSAYQAVYPASPKTNGLAVASMVVSLVSVVFLLCYGVGGAMGVVGAVLGHVSKRQIRARGEGGRGMATAGIVVGWCVTAIAVGIVLLLVWVFRHIGDPIPTPDPIYTE
jgi:hypothetical protein